MEMNHKNTNIKKNIFAGVKGNISSKIAFDASANFKEVENMVFFENLCENNQRFQLVYKNVDYGTFHGELLYEKNDYLDFSIEGNIYTYNIEIEELSHIPKFDAQITARYNLQNKIILSSDIFFIGKRYANIYAANCNTAQTLMALSPIELDGTVDFNLGVEYFKNKNLSAFLKFNNIFAKKYFYWNQYPGQGFNVMAGVNFSF
jgi:outer membrane receptor protein involved in Fe transport